MPATIAAAKAGVTTGEWAQALRDSFGEYRGPTGVGGSASGASEELLSEIRKRVDEVSDGLGHRIRILVGKPGLDGHSNGAEQIAASAADEDVDVVGLSILSGSHMELIPDTVRLLRDRDVDAPVVIGGIIPAGHVQKLLDAGVARVYTPKDFEINRIMTEIVDLVAERAGSAEPAGSTA
jgi:(2R)-ethylmalonyl-CoA mutase